MRLEGASQLSGSVARPGTERLIVGTMNFGDTVEASEAARILDAAVGCGVRAIDTANVYSRGAAEEIVGKWLRSRPALDVEIATKVGMQAAGASGLAPLGSRTIAEEVSASLERLGQERLSILYLHQPDRTTPVSETIAAVQDLVVAGVVGELGVSNYAAWQIEVLDREAEASAGPRPVVAQQMYNLLATQIETEYVEYAKVRGLCTIVYNPLAGGLLAGSHDPGGGRFGASALAPMYRKRYLRPELVRVASLFVDLARLAGLAPAQAAYRWLLGKAHVDAVVVGASRAEHILDAVGAAEAGPLPTGLADLCEQLIDNLRSPMPGYSR